MTQEIENMFSYYILAYLEGNELSINTTYTRLVNAYNSGKIETTDFIELKDFYLS